jgi:hypothetical protein
LIDRIEADLTLFLGDPNVCEWNRQHSSQTLGPFRVVLKLLAPGLEIAPIEVTSKSNRFSASAWLRFFKVLLDSLLAVSEDGYVEHHAGKPSAKGQDSSQG